MPSASPLHGTGEGTAHVTTGTGAAALGQMVSEKAISIIATCVKKLAGLEATFQFISC